MNVFNLRWRGPITVSKRSRLIVRGHGRLDGALLMSAKKVPVDYKDYASEAEELAGLRVASRFSELAEPRPTVTFFWLIEEFRISILAQKLGTSRLASASRLQCCLKEK